MYRLRQIPAVLALLSLCLPWARVVVVSAHLSPGHDREASAPHADDLKESFHGHRHGRGEADHTHPSVGFDVVARRAEVIAGVVGPSAIETTQVRPAPAAVPEFKRLRENPGKDYGPPGGGSSRLILRI